MAEHLRPNDTLERIVAQYYTCILRMCCVILRNPTAAEDAAQETFLKAYRSFHTFRGQSSEKTWLTSIAINVCRDMQRSAWVRHTEKRVTPEDLPLSVPAGDDDALALGQAIAGLPEKYRDAVLLHYYQDLTLQEAAIILKTTPSTISKRLTRARDMLRQALEVTLP